MISGLLTRLFSWYGKRTVITIATIVVVLALAGLYLAFGRSSSTPSDVPQSVKSVTLVRVGDMKESATSLSVLGTVESTREARLNAEAGGRVTSVSAKLGETVYAGQVLATIENSRERAVVLQAQGAYESALAGASQSSLGSASADRAYTEAETSARNTFRTAFTTSDGVIRNLTDELFSNPDTLSPGVALDTKGRAPELAKTRVEIGAMLTDWNRAVSTSASADALTLLDTAEANTRKINDFVTILAQIVSVEDPNSQLTAGDLALYKTRFAGARAELDGTLQAISGARNALNGAKTARDQAAIAAASGSISQSDAQLKQALGALRLAQSSLEKTIIRTPITGTVQSLTVKEGSPIGMGQPAAVVSNEGALEVVAYVTESDARSLEVGDKATIEGGVEGVITQIASAIDPSTKKIELRIGINDAKGVLTNGQAATVAIASNAAGVKTDSTIRLPIIALKMTPDGAVVFTVDENKKLVAHPVVLGAITGDSVVIASGVTTDMVIVSDARGLRAEEVVTTN